MLVPALGAGALPALARLSSHSLQPSLCVIRRTRTSGFRQGERAATRPGAELLRPSSSQLTPECGERCLDFARHLHLLGRAATVGFYQEAGLMAAILLTAWPGNNFLPGSCVLLFWWSTVPRSGPLEAAGLQHSCRESLQQLWDTAAASAPCLP